MHAQAGRSVAVFVAPDAQPHELRSALALALALHDSAPLRLYRRVDGRLVPCAWSAAALLSDDGQLLLDAGAPPSPSWWWQHTAQLCGLASLAGLAALPRPRGGLCLLSLALAAAARAPGPASLLSRAASTAATFATAYVFCVVDAAAVPPLLAILGCCISGAAALYRARVLLVGIAVMLAQLGVGRVAALEARMRAGGKPAARAHAGRS